MLPYNSNAPNVSPEDQDKISEQVKEVTEAQETLEESVSSQATQKTQELSTVTKGQTLNYGNEESLDEAEYESLEALDIKQNEQTSIEYIYQNQDSLNMECKNESQEIEEKLDSLSKNTKLPPLPSKLKEELENAAIQSIGPENIATGSRQSIEKKDFIRSKERSGKASSSKDLNRNSSAQAKHPTTPNARLSMPQAKRWSARRCNIL